MATDETTIGDADKHRELLTQLREANDVLSAIKHGEVDALLISHQQRDQVYILKGADHVYRVLVEEMQEGYLAVDIDGNVLFCNKNFAELVDVSLEKIIGAPAGLFIPAENLAEMNKVLLSGQARYKSETLITSRTGRNIPVKISTARLDDEKGLFACLVITDLTEQIRREKLTNLVLDQATEAILVCNTAGIIVKANGIAVSLFGKEIVARHFNAAVPLYNEISGLSLGLDSLIADREAKRIEVCYDGADEVFYFIASATKLLDKENGEAFGAVVMLTDITANRRLKNEMSRLDRLNLIGEMAAGIGHEVRNPMTTVRGFLQHFFQKKEFTNHQSSLKLMIEELDRANLIITEFLSLAKNKTVDMNLVNLGDIVKNLLPLIQADAFRMGHKLKFRQGITCSVLADEKEIRQCLLNLVRNGLEAMNERGVLTIETKERDGAVILSVTDQGKGIPDSIRDKLGTPFLTTKDNGTGLGLPVCYRIAERHKAKLDIKTGPAGTTFSLIFELM